MVGDKFTPQVGKGGVELGKKSDITNTGTKVAKRTSGVGGFYKKSPPSSLSVSKSLTIKTIYFVPTPKRL